MLTNLFLHGAMAMGCAAICLFFVRFSLRTGDRLFAFLAASFGLLTVERLLLAMVPVADERRPFVYIVRLIAFVLIIIGVLDKNRAKGTSGTAR